MPNSSSESFDNWLPSLDDMMPDLENITNEVNRITDSIEKHFKAVASSLLEYPVAASIRETIQSSPWLYEKPAPPPPPLGATPLGYIGACKHWVSENRAVSAAIVAFVGTGAIIIWHRRTADRAKRRAKRAKNGARTDVVVLAGSPQSPLTRSLSLDLEKRGFIIYIPVSSQFEEQVVQSEARADIRPLHLDVTSEQSVDQALERLNAHLTTSQRPHPQSASHTLNLASLIIIPPLSLPTATISSVPPAVWADALNADVLSTFTLLRAFLPLLKSQHATLAVLTPSAIPSLTPASHALESVVATSINAYVSTLRRELSGTELNITTIKLGHFDYGPTSLERQLVARRPEQRTRAAEEEGRRRRYALRELHNCVFDVIASNKGRRGTVFVGRGSRMYHIVGRWAPQGLVGWMLGMRQAGEDNFPKGGERVYMGSQEWEEVAKED